MRTTGYPAFLNLFLSLMIAAGIWFFLAPTQLGGWVTYVIVDGNSMEPRFHLGDLALTRTQTSYQLGDAVAYKNAEMGRYVFHRIVKIESDRFILKGDNNTWLDSYHPNQEEIIGKLWIHLPKVGNFVQWLRQPLVLAFGCALFGGVIMTSLFLPPSQRGKTKRRDFIGLEEILKGGLYLAGFAAVIFLGLGIFAFVRPLSASLETFQYQQDGRFFYSAPAAPGIYDGDVVRTGDPLFPKLGCVMNVGMAYNLVGGNLQNIVGTRLLFARILEEQSGWQRLIPLEAETAYSGNSYLSSAQVDLCQIQAMVSSLEQQTGMRSSVYTLEVIAHSSFVGTMDGKPISDSFDATLPFKFDEAHFYLATDVTPGEALQVIKPGEIAGQVQVPNTLSLFGLEFSILTARIFSLLGLTLTLIFMAGIGWYFFQTYRPGPETLLSLKYSGLIMDARGLNFPQSLPMVDVASFDDLARLAERQSTLITHVEVNFLHVYMVQCNGVLYRYAFASSQPNAALSEPPAPRGLPVGRINDNYIDAAPYDDDF